MYVNHSITVCIIKLLVRNLVICADGNVRLIGGSNEVTGRVEVCINERWGTICSESWDSIDAGVICSQLGYSRYSKLLFTS